MHIYGNDFAAVYNDKWQDFSARMWPFLWETIQKHKPDAKTWLDLCCGTGRLLKLVCENGFSAVGLDLSPHQLKYAKVNAPAATLVQADVRDFSLAQEFDMVTCIFDSLNYLTTKKDLGRALRRARRHLSEDGSFVFDMNTFAGLQDTWCHISTIREPHRVIINETSFDEKRGLGRCLITGFVKQGRAYRKFEEEHIERGYKAEEIEDALARCEFGFKKYDGYSLSRPRKRSARLLYVCHRE